MRRLIALVLLLLLPVITYGAPRKRLPPPLESLRTDIGLFQVVKKTGPNTFLSYVDFAVIPTPVNPPAGFIRLYADILSNNFLCINSSGVSCLGGSGGGGSSGLTLTNTTLVSPLISQQISLLSTSNYIITWSAPAAQRTLLIADPGGSDSFVFMGAPQILTNKTLSGGTLSGSFAGSPTFTGFGITFDNNISVDSVSADGIGLGPAGVIDMFSLPMGTGEVGTVRLGANGTLVVSESGGAVKNVMLKMYDHNGSEGINAHAVVDSVALVLGSVTVTLASGAAFSSSNSYVCIPTDNTAANMVTVTQTDGSHFTLTGTGADVVRYVCVGR